MNGSLSARKKLRMTLHLPPDEKSLAAPGLPPQK
jgi:hypothetical protein